MRSNELDFKAARSSFGRERTLRGKLERMHARKNVSQMHSLKMIDFSELLRTLIPV